MKYLRRTVLSLSHPELIEGSKGLFGKRSYRPGDFYKAHRLRWQTWQPVKPWDALNISLRYGYDTVAWGRW